MTIRYGLVSPMQRALLRRLTREQRAELAAAREEQLRAVAVANLIALMIERELRYDQYLERVDR
jgi:hypothetical protein